MKIIIGSASKQLESSMVSRLNAEIFLPIRISKFADGEINVEVTTNNLYSQEVYLVQSLSPYVNDNLMELLLTIDAVKRSGAKKITAIIPYYGYSRQDKVVENDNMRSALGGKLIANLIQIAGASDVAIIDLHSGQIEGFFDIPVTNLRCFEIFIASISKENLAIVAPDIGAVNRARAFAKALEKECKLDNDIVVVDKSREKAGTSKVVNVIGEVANRNCVIIDDIVDSAGTLCNAAFALKTRGAKSVVSCVTHGVFSGNAIEKISSSFLDKLIITNTIFHELKENDKIEIVSIANILICFMQKGR